MKPGTTNLPRPSTTSASAGTRTSRAVPMAAILPPRTSTVTSRSGLAPVASITVVPVTATAEPEPVAVVRAAASPMLPTAMPAPIPRPAPRTRRRESPAVITCLHRSSG
jgi:hypothetical protein